MHIHRHRHIIQTCIHIYRYTYRTTAPRSTFGAKFGGNAVLLKDFLPLLQLAFPEIRGLFRSPYYQDHRKNVGSILGSNVFWKLPTPWKHRHMDLNSRGLIVKTPTKRTPMTPNLWKQPGVHVCGEGGEYESAGLVARKGPYRD